MVEQRQIAERQRQQGNAAFNAQQYSEALRYYQLGLEVQRHSMALHANAAAAALKLQCYVEAMEHCDKVSGCSLHGRHQARWSTSLGSRLSGLGFVPCWVCRGGEHPTHVIRSYCFAIATSCCVTS